MISITKCSVGVKIKSYSGCLLVLVLAFSIMSCGDDQDEWDFYDPHVRIYKPEDNSSFPFGTMIEFQAAGRAPEHGIVNTVYGWTISSYPNFYYKSHDPWATDTLSIGKHTVTATVNSKYGIAKDHVNITITPN